MLAHFSPEGRISGLAGMQDDPRFFQTSVSIQPGNSGSALMNLKGNVVGVMVRRLNEAATLLDSGTLPQNVNYAVKSAHALSLLEADPKLAKFLKRPGAKERPLETLADRLGWSYFSDPKWTNYPKRFYRVRTP